MGVLLGVLIACFGSIVYLFYRQLAVPLEGLTRAAKTNVKRGTERDGSSASKARS